MTTPEHDSQDSIPLDFNGLTALYQGQGMTRRNALKKAQRVVDLRGRGGGSSNISLPVNEEVDARPPHPSSSSSPLPPSSEVLRRKLRELGIQNVNQVLRNFNRELIEQALEDYETAMRDEFHPRSPTGYFWSLLK